MSWDKGFNFRGTSGFIADGTDETYSIGAAYPETRNSVTFGWTSPPTAGANRSTLNERRLAGINYKSNNGTQAVFRVDLPAPGQYSIRLSLGDHDGAQPYQYAEILDGTTSLAIIDDPTGTGANGFDDATGTEYTNVTWPGSNTAVTLTFATTTLNLKIATPGVQSANTTLTHLFVSQVASGPSAAVTGTATASITESDLVTGGKTIILTLSNDTWVS